jgi:hypothetical protein
MTDEIDADLVTSRLGMRKTVANLLVSFISGNIIWTELTVKEKNYFKNDHFANLKTLDANTKTESYRIETLEAKAPNR